MAHRQSDREHCWGRDSGSLSQGEGEGRAGLLQNLQNLVQNESEGTLLKNC